MESRADTLATYFPGEVSCPLKGREQQRWGRPKFDGVQSCLAWSPRAFVVRHSFGICMMSYAEFFLQSLFYPVLDFLKFIPRTHLDNHTGVERGIMLTHLPKMYGVKSITPSKSDTAPMTESVPISSGLPSMSVLMVPPISVRSR